MKYEELVERVAMGEEFQFYFKGGSFWISQNEKGYYLTREIDNFSQSFCTAEELFIHAKIDGKVILEIWDAIDI